MSDQEQISADDMVFHNQVVADIRRVQQMAIAANGTMQSWSRHLAGKYSLGPEDAIDEAGRIHRSPKEA